MGLCLQINFHFKNVTKFKISSDAEVCDRQKEGNTTIQRENNEKEKKQNSSQTNILLNTVTPNIFSLQEHKQTIINQIPAVTFCTLESLDSAAAEIYFNCLTFPI